VKLPDFILPIKKQRRACVRCGAASGSTLRMDPGHRPSRGITLNPPKSLQRKAEDQSSAVTRDKPAAHSACSPGPGRSAEPAKRDGNCCPSRR